MQRRFALIGHVHTLSDITDLEITGVADNNLLQYDSATATWTNRTYLSLNEIADPGLAPTGEAWIHAEDVAGFTQLQYNVESRKWAFGQDNYIICRNTSGGAMTVGQAVYVSGTTGQRPEIGLADADVYTHAFGLVADAAANNGYTRVVTHGLLTAVDTSAWAAGSQLYLSGTAGALTTTDTTHPAASQPIAIVIYQHAVNGILFVHHHSDSRHADGSHHDTFTIGSSATDRAVLDITSSALTASRTFKFPDVSGTFPTLENSHTYTAWQTFSSGADFGGGNAYVHRTDVGRVFFGLLNSSAAANERDWDLGTTADHRTLNIAAWTDGGVERAAWAATRTLGAITSVTYGNSTNLPDHQFYGDVTIGDATGKFMAEGTSTALPSATISADGANSYPQFFIQKFSGAGDTGDDYGGGLVFRHALGTSAAPSAVASGDVPGQVLFSVYGTSSYLQGGALRYTTDGAATTTVAGHVSVLCYTGTAFVDDTYARMKWYDDGEVALGTAGWFSNVTYMEMTEASAPSILFNTTGAALNEKFWVLESASATGNFGIFTALDAGGSQKTAIEFGRNGNAVNAINYGNVTDLPLHTLYGPVLLYSTTPDIRFYESDEAADEKYWRMFSSGGNLYIRAYNDALSTQSAVLEVTRGTGKAISIVTYGNVTDVPQHRFYGDLMGYDSSGVNTLFADIGDAAAGSYVYAQGHEWTEMGVIVAADVAYGGGLQMAKARGTLTSLSAALSGDNTGELFWATRGTSGWIYPCGLGHILTADTTATTAAGYLYIQVGSTSAPTHKLRLYSTGEAYWGADVFHTFDEMVAPSTPAAGRAALYLDTTANPTFRQIDDAGKDYSLLGVKNYSTAAQAITAASRTYITGSALAVPVTKLQVGTCFRWRFNVTKTAAGTAASTYDVCFGTAATTAATARLSFTKPAGTAAADEGVIEINCVIRSIGAAGVAVGEFWMGHNLASTGHMTIPNACVNAVSAGFDMTVANLIAGVCVTSGASDALTIQMVQAEAWNI